jgi:GMP reductase
VEREIFAKKSLTNNGDKMEEKIIREYNYSDVYLIPRERKARNRMKDCDISVKFANRNFAMPLCPSNMECVVDEETCVFLAEQGMLYIMHRFGTNNADFIEYMQSKGHYASISIGINDDSYDQLKEIKNRNLVPEIITIDIAHAFGPGTEDMVKYTKDNFPNSFLIVGNVATGDAVEAMETYGADATKLFIGPGHACTTKIMTGFTRPTISCLLECSSVAKKPLIADGGVTDVGDVAKAMAAGASMVMCGFLFVGYDQSSGKIVEINGKKFKEYYGSSSEFSKNKLEKKHIEDHKILVDYKGDMKDFIKNLKESMTSMVSYGGELDWSGLRSCRLVAIR